jgi:hypothetical protein
VYPQNENLHVGEIILFVLLAVLAQKRATIALRCRKIKLHVLQPMSVLDQEKENSLHLQYADTVRLSQKEQCLTRFQIVSWSRHKTQSPVLSLELNLHVRHIGRIRCQAYSGAQTRVSRRVTLPERFEKPKLRSG